MRILLLTLCLALGACKATPLSEFKTNLGLVVIDTDGEEMGKRDRSVWSDNDWVAANIAVFDPGDGHATLRTSADYDGPGAIHVRGNSSREYEKRSFRIELRDRKRQDVDASLLGMPEEADWILQGPYSDKTLMRNHLMYTLSNDIGTYAARTRLVELFVVDNRRKPSDHHYRGVYVLMERIERDKERIGMEKISTTDVTEPNISGGYLLKRDWWEQEDQRIKTSIYKDTLLVEDPQKLADAQRDWLEAWFTDFETSLDGPGYADFVDVDSFVDHMLLVEFGRTVDGYVLSTWMYKDRQGPLTMGPIWDYNGGLGNADYFQGWKTEGWHYDNPEFPEDNPHGFDWYEKMLEDSAFRVRLAERWHTHRAGALADDAILARIDEAHEKLEHAAPRNFERWKVLGEYVWPNDDGSEDRDSWDEEVDYMEAWLLERAAWMDGAVDTLAAD